MVSRRCEDERPGAALDFDCVQESIVLSGLRVHASRGSELGKGEKCIAHESMFHQQTESNILWGTSINVQKQQQLYDVSKA